MSERIDRYWPLIVLLLFIMLAGSGIILFIRQTNTQATEIILRETPDIPASGEVFIGGNVNNPGFYPFKSAETLATILQAASPSSDIGSITIHIGKNGETASPQKVSLNSAETWLLALLPGIGQGKAQAIVSYRTRHGHFKHTADVLNVDGIGDATFEKIKGFITVED